MGFSIGVDHSINLVFSVTAGLYSPAPSCARGTSSKLGRRGCPTASVRTSARDSPPIRAARSKRNPIPNRLGGRESRWPPKTNEALSHEPATVSPNSLAQVRSQVTCGWSQLSIRRAIGSERRGSGRIAGNPEVAQKRHYRKLLFT